MFKFIVISVFSLALFIFGVVVGNQITTAHFCSQVECVNENPTAQDNPLRHA